MRSDGNHSAQTKMVSTKMDIHPDRWSTRCLPLRATLLLSDGNVVASPLTSSEMTDSATLRASSPSSPTTPTAAPRALPRSDSCRSPLPDERNVWLFRCCVFFWLELTLMTTCRNSERDQKERIKQQKENRGRQSLASCIISEKETRPTALMGVGETFVSLRMGSHCSKQQGTPHPAI